MKFDRQLIIGEIRGTGYKEKSVYKVAYDEKQSILHLFDNNYHRSTSIVNQINHVYVDDILQAMGIPLNYEQVRCIIYQTQAYNNDPIYSVISEYNEDKGGNNPFIHLDDETIQAIGYEPFFDYIYRKDKE